MTRPRTSKDFIRQHQRERLGTALASCIVEKGFRGTTVADVVSTAHVARNTFYDCFGSKVEAAIYLLGSVVLDDLKTPVRGAEFVLALEIAARLKLDDQLGASARIADAEQLLDRAVKVEPLEPQGTEDDPQLAQLPPGRHGLPRLFVVGNQRRRLLAGTARAIYEDGYEKATIADVTRLAAVSRRTFYEHFEGKDDAVFAMVRDGEDQSGISLDGLDFSRGLDQLLAEIVAAAFCGDEVGSESRRKAGQTVVRMLAAQLDVAVAA